MSTINIITKEESGKVYYVKALKYDPKKMKDFDDVIAFIIKTLKWPKSVYCNYDAKTIQCIIKNDALNKTGQLDWKINFSKLKFKDAFRLNGNSPITIVAVCYPVAIGLGSGIDEELGYVELSKIIFSIIRCLYYCVFPYKLLLRKYNFSRLFIADTIKQCEVWRLGFISTEEFRYKKIVEYSIMKKLRYNKVGDRWIANSIERCKYPFEIIREDRIE